MTTVTILRVAVALMAVVVSCARDEVNTTPHTAEPTHKANEKQVELHGRAVDEDGTPLVARDLFLEVFKACRHEKSSFSGSTGHRTTTDAEGRLTLRIAQRVDEDCTRAVVVRLAARDVLDLPTELQPCARVELPDFEEALDFDLGLVRLTAPASPRRLQHLSDDELERATVVAQTSSLSPPERELETLLTEMVRRGGERFAAFLEAQLESSRAETAEHSSPEREFFLLTALRRVQHRPDPLSVRIVDGASTAVPFPLAPVFRVQLVNVDAPGTSLLVLDEAVGRSEWCRHWHVEVRTLDGERVPLRVWPFLGSTGKDARRTLAPGEAVDDRVVLALYAAFTTAGTYEARLHYQEQAYIAQERDLAGRIVSSSPWTRFEIRPGTVRSTAAEYERARAAIAAVDDTTPVRVPYRTYDPQQPFTAEPRTSEEVLWTLGWKSVKPLLDALGEERLGAHERAWILAQLYRLTGLNDPTTERGGFGLSPDFALTDKVDEAQQIAFAQRWKKSAQSFVFEIVPDAQAK